MAAHDMSKLRDDMSNLRQAILFSLPVAISVIGLIAWYLAGKAIIPVRRLTQSVTEITAEALNKRLESENEPPEFAKLIEGYNQMLDRLERSFTQARRFSADAAHELNTPLTILRGHLDLMLQSANEDAEEQKQLAMVFEEVRGLQEVIRKLLLLSQADSGELSIENKDIDLSYLLEEIIEDAEIMAPEIRFEQKIEPDVTIRGDRDLLRQCVFNLVTNAIKYNRQDGAVRLALRKSQYCAELDVTNTGFAIPEEMVGKVFERFFRVDPSRDAKISGRGLGLSIAREFAKAHHGTLELGDNEEDKITFRLSLPIV
jgi:heavy metal sensor kinase